VSLPRRTVVVAALLSGALVLLAAGQTWVHATGLSSGAVPEVTSDGSDASGVTTAMAVVVLAAGLALTVARSVGRWIVGVLMVLAGVVLAVTAVQAALDPAAAAAPAVSAATGTTEAAAHYAVTAWPWVAAAGGLLAALVGVAALVAGRHWRHSRRFESPAAAPSEGERGTTTAPASGAHGASSTGSADGISPGSAHGRDESTDGRGEPSTAAAGRGEPSAAAGRRRGAQQAHRTPDGDRLDAMDAWDELSAGNDPTR
jgi:uncharacterized membrane protein (TIGR02234 family)